MKTQKTRAEIGKRSEYDHPLWIKRRNEILEVDAHACRRCKSPDNLNVHHLVYHHGNSIWEYSDGELVTLCHSCHNEIHHYKESVSTSLMYLMTGWAYNTEACDYYDISIILSSLVSMHFAKSKMAARMIICDLEILRGE